MIGIRQTGPAAPLNLDRSRLGTARSAAAGDLRRGEGRALIAVSPPPSPHYPPVRARRYRPLAPFIAHLIATRDSLPQTRLRGRASHEIAAAAYGTRALPAAAGQSIARSI